MNKMIKKVSTLLIVGLILSLNSCKKEAKKETKKQAQ